MNLYVCIVYTIHTYICTCFCKNLYICTFFCIKSLYNFSLNKRGKNAFSSGIEKFLKYFLDLFLNDGWKGCWTVCALLCQNHMFLRYFLHTFPCLLTVLISSLHPFLKSPLYPLPFLPDILFSFSISSPIFLYPFFCLSFLL